MLSIIVVFILIITTNYGFNSDPTSTPNFNSKKNLKLLVFNNENCYANYFKYVKPTHYENKNNKIYISFTDYLEYWWDSEESMEELIKKVCKIIDEKKMINSHNSLK